MIKLLLLCVFLQGNPTFLIQTPNLTIFTEVKEGSTFITINEQIVPPYKGIKETRRVACYEVMTMNPTNDGIEFNMCCHQHVFVPNNKEEMGLLTEQHEGGMTAIVFDNRGILFSGMLEDLAKMSK